ncbi:MAG: hypothetical protein ACKVJR_09055 [Flavobacteriales bacterium]|jgi:hypothetical protein
MTEQEAKNHLYDLWQNGAIPNNFTEDHSDFHKAVNYTKTTMKLLIQEISLRKYFLILFASFISSLLFSMIIVLVILKLDIISDGDYSFLNYSIH